MSEAWKQWEGQVVNGEFHLGSYLGGSDHSAVLLTELSERGLQQAAIKLIAADPENAELRLSRCLNASLQRSSFVAVVLSGKHNLGSFLSKVILEAYGLSGAAFSLRVRD